MRPGRAPDGVDEDLAGDRETNGVELGPHRGEALGRRRRMQASEVGCRGRRVDDPLPGSDDPGSEPGTVGRSRLHGDGGDDVVGASPGVVDLGSGGGDDDRLHPVLLQQEGDLTAEGRVAEHDDPLDRLSVVVLPQQLAVGGDDLASEPGPARDLRDERPAAVCRQLLCRRAGVVPGDHQGPRSTFQHEFGTSWVARVVVGRVTRGGRRLGLGLCIGLRLEGTGQRLAIREIEMDRTGIEDARRRVVGLTRELARRPLLTLRTRRGLGDHGEACRGTVEVVLPRRLIRADPVGLRGPVGGEDDERHTRLVRLEDGRVQIRGRSPRGGDHDGRPAGLDAQAQREESGDPFVDPHVQGDPSRGRELRRRKRERLRARAGTHHDV